ncbi:MBL fold metallo-hydrolase [Virgibacillus dakarensis]|uniref:Hydrolase n=1 Tax=Lentibacillus populi TaxID=1827502 RepID=A0A9W5TVU1_9BACI|nr:MULTISPECIES: MBL fold metallo-hydrolase [Bacillaceae]MBT2214373.1 MBL fold metallo-hydrolase [Virgibacillus dakarensis]MTW85052.1 MBL fold metallo-hydrolase [Virgibacillus dakarensis]GGB34349.1 hydrolase [Lentibacillus populi]
MKVLHDTITKITIPTPYAVGDVHVYLLKGDTLSLVDAGVKTKAAWEALVAQLKQLGYAPNDIEQHILTHHHPDHIGLVGEFPRAYSIVGHQYNEPWLTRDKAFLKKYEQFYKDYFALSGVPNKYLEKLDKLKAPLALIGEGELTVELNEGDRLPGHEEWQVIETKGHAQSHLSFYREADGSFIGGDHLLRSISPNPILEPPHDGEKERPKPLLQYRANLRKCLKLGVNTVYPGHGEIFSNVDELIPMRMKKQEQRAKKVFDILQEKEQTPFAICQQLFPKKFEEQLDLTISETIGQLDFLEEEGKVTVRMDDGQLFYQVK